VNYYEHHLGDYLRDTAHLTMIEDGAYRRMLDAYYTRERPLPADVKDICRLVRATSKTERIAVETVLGEFFFASESGWRHKRCDEEIDRYLEKQPAAAAKKEGDRERQRRARDRRKVLFDQLREHGQVAPWNATTDELQQLLSRVTGANRHTSVTGHVTRNNTASQSPVPSPQSPVSNSQSTESRARKRGAPSARSCPDEFLVTDTMRQWAARECPGIDVDRETAVFRDYTFASPKTDWVKTWRNWMRKAKPAGGRRLTKYEESMAELDRRSAQRDTAAAGPPLAALGSDLWPQVRGSIRPVAERGMGGGDGEHDGGPSEIRFPKAG
jgi:uncharacterized protein YdaU (DUF1376 family)